MQIVVIDDSPTNLVVLRSLAAKITDSCCLSFSDSERAIEHLLNNATDVIIVDYSMPRITGIELIKQMRASSKNAATPIIMVTGSTEIAVRRRAIEVGATAFLNKPVKPAEFLAGIMSVTSHATA